MSFQDWENSGWLRAHKTSKLEIQQLMAIVNRDLKDARQKGVSADWRFGIAYNAALKLCTILLYVQGFRPEKTLAHYRTLQALPFILGPEKDDDADYLDTCRTKRNTVEYDYVGGVTNSDADELIAYVMKLKIEVLGWLKQNHPDLSESSTNT